MVEYYIKFSRHVSAISIFNFVVLIYLCIFSIKYLLASQKLAAMLKYGIMFVIVVTELANHCKILVNCCPWWAGRTGAVALCYFIITDSLEWNRRTTLQKKHHARNETKKGVNIASAVLLP